MINEHNPDVLSCLANLSSDEVFTPPALANQMLDLLPASIWRDKNATFLDPATKSGIFLREIAKRLMVGLEKEIPNQQERINHIFKNQLFGLAITELTALLSRRSTYCSKTANGKYSVCDAFTNPQGNILFKRVEHKWENGHCAFCGASESEYGEIVRSGGLETHAYQFIHTVKPEELFNMKFDVVVGNPPYQLSDGGFGRSASPIYQEFVQQAKKLAPRYLTMIIPSRWFAGGKGLDEFRKNMLNDDRMRKIVDFEDATEVFPGVDIAGGVCYFLWEKDSSGNCEVITMHKGEASKSIRPLNEFGTLIRQGSAVSIIRKVQAKNEPSMNTQVSSAKPFGLRTFVRPSKKGDLLLRYGNNREGPFERKNVTLGQEMIDQWKVIVSKVSYDHAGQPDKDGMRRVFGIVDILPPGTICTETYLIAGSYKDKKSAKNLVSYLKTNFVRFLVAQLSFSHDVFKEKFQFVPILDMKTEWTDELLYKRYGLTKAEIEFIESKIKPMELVNA
jgi:site-specific DNA-methyltransferase (adenine-specific)